MPVKQDCVYCHQSFVPFRSDTEYCSPRCRYRYRYEKDLHTKQQSLYLTELSELKEELKTLESENFVSLFSFKKHDPQQEQNTSFLATKKHLDGLNDQELLNLISKREIDKHEKGSEQRYNLQRRFSNMSKSELQDYIVQYRKKLSDTAKEIEKQRIEKVNRPIYIKKRIEEIKLRIRELEPLARQEYVPDAPKEQQQGVRRQKIIQRPRTSRELGGADVRNMSFMCLQLSGELGRFLGELDRNMVAFALTGDAGAGKSYFSFEIARTLLDNHLKVKYYSLEEGIGALTQKKLSRYGIGNELKITDSATLEDVQKDAGYYDALIIDSYSKLSDDPQEFENLRQQNPNTIFVVVFQKTTAKTIRGGSSIKYNSSATINVIMQGNERVAIMEKGRYGTQNWVYSIDKGKIIKEN